MLFILGAGGVHPVSGAVTIPGAVLDGTSPSLVIAEFYPCAANGDEYLVLSNRGSEAVNLFNWSVSDGEGAIRFLGGVLLPGQTLSMSENASSYASVYGMPPDITVVDWMS
ncbi:MAG TPA: lamin tail domain-containing protein, partial [Thermoplasmata archaeon]|nr:lamin tail domain-containing protein [Thermoplasmata archaeon]